MENSLESETQASIAKRRREKWRHVVNQLVFAGLFVAAMIIPERLSSNVSSAGMKLLTAGLPILVVSAWTWAIIAHVRKLEEFERTLAVNSFAITFGAFLWAITCYEIFALSMDVPTLPMVLLAPAAIVVWHVFWEVLRKRFI